MIVVKASTRRVGIMTRALIVLQENGPQELVKQMNNVNYVHNGRVKQTHTAYITRSRTREIRKI